MILEQAVNAAESIAIAGHVRPDGDCAGACFAMYNYIQENYNSDFSKEIHVYMEGMPESFAFLKNSDKAISDCSEDRQYDLFIALDCSSADRLGEVCKYFESAKNTICFDHHVTNSGCFANQTVCKPDYSSTCEVLWEEFEKDKISLPVAEALYLGIIHDTGVFKHSNTTERTMCAAGKLLSYGVASEKLIDSTFFEKSYVENQILGRCLMESMLVLDKRVILSTLSRRVMDLYGVVPANLSGIIDQLRVTKGIEVAIFIYESNPSEYKISMRANNNVDVSKTAQFFGGGGHKKAAGFTAKGQLHDVINNLLAGLEHQLNEAGITTSEE